MSFVVYSKDGCPYCTKVESVLKMAKLEHVIYKLNKDFTRDNLISQFGEGSTFPQVVVGDKHLGGCVETIKYLKENKII